MIEQTPSPTDADGELKLILSEHWRDEGQHTSVYPVCPECRTRLLALIQAERAQAALEARKEQIMQDELSLEFLTDDIGQDIFPHENVLIQWRIDQLAALKQGANHAK